MLISNGWESFERPTPQTLIEAIMVVVRERGIRALTEPDTRARLRQCDEAARTQINQRIEKLLAAGRIREPQNA